MYDNDDEEEEFHLSIKNNLRKIVHVRNVFKDLTPYEEQILEYHKILAEKRKLAQEAQRKSQQSTPTPVISPSEFTINLESRKKILRPSNVTFKPETTLEQNKMKETRIEAILPERMQTKTVLGKSVNFNDKNIYFSNVSRNTTLPEDTELYKTAMIQDDNVKYFYDNKENALKAKKVPEKRKEFNLQEANQQYQQQYIYKNYKQSGIDRKNENNRPSNLQAKQKSTNEYRDFLEEMNLNLKYLKNYSQTQNKKAEYFPKNFSPNFDGRERYYNNYSYQQQARHRQPYHHISHHQKSHQAFIYGKTRLNDYSSENVFKESNNYNRQRTNNENFQGLKANTNNINMQRSPLIYKTFLMNNQFNNFSPSYVPTLSPTHQKPSTYQSFYKQHYQLIVPDLNNNRKHYRY
jgi:hypothetical protein